MAISAFVFSGECPPVLFILYFLCWQVPRVTPKRGGAGYLSWLKSWLKTSYKHLWNLKQDLSLDFWSHNKVVIQEHTFLGAITEFESVTESKRHISVTQQQQYFKMIDKKSTSQRWFWQVPINSVLQLLLWVINLPGGRDHKWPPTPSSEAGSSLHFDQTVCMACFGTPSLNRILLPASSVLFLTFNLNLCSQFSQFVFSL